VAGDDDLWLWYKFWVDRWLLSRHVMAMDWAERGLFVHLLCHQWREGAHGLPADPCELREMCPGWDGDLPQRVLDRFPVAPDGRRRNTKLEDEREARIARRRRYQAAGSKGGRVSGKRSVAPASLKRRSSDAGAREKRERDPPLSERGVEGGSPPAQGGAGGAPTDDPASHQPFGRRRVWDPGCPHCGGGRYRQNGALCNCGRYVEE